MFPIQSLGTDYIVTMPHTPHGEGEWVRIMAFYDNTKIVFDPPVSGTNGGILGAGEVLDLPERCGPVRGARQRPHLRRPLRARRVRPRSPTTPACPRPDLGDPSECPAIPIAQYRSTYTFLAPSSYARELDRRRGAHGRARRSPSTAPTCRRATSRRSAASPSAIAHEQLPNGQAGPLDHGQRDLRPLRLRLRLAHQLHVPGRPRPARPEHPAAARPISRSLNHPARPPEGRPGLTRSAGRRPGAAAPPASPGRWSRSCRWSAPRASRPRSPRRSR